MTFAKSTALKIAIETQPEQRTKLPVVARSKDKIGQGVAQDQVTAFGQEADSVSVAVYAEPPSGQESSIQPDASILTWQTPNAEPTGDLSAGMESFTILAQAPASVLSDLPAKQAQSIAASAPGLSLPTAGLLGAGAVIAGVAGGSSGSGGTPVDPAKNDKPTITAGLKHDPVNDTGVFENDNVTSNIIPELVGLSAKNASVKIVLDGQTYATTTKADGSWSVFVGTVGVGNFLADGDYTPTIATLGVPGVSETPKDGTPFTVDTTEPDVSKVTVALDAASDTGVKGDGVTYSTTPTISGILDDAVPGDLVNLTLVSGLDEVSYESIPVGADGKWSKVVNLTAGDWTPSVTVSDVAGNRDLNGSQVGDSFEIVTQAASSTISLDPASETGNSQERSLSDGVTSNTLPTFLGMVDVWREGTTVLVTLASAVETIVSQPVGLEADGSWTYTPTKALAPGEYSAKVVVKDAVGRESTPSEAEQKIVIDTKAFALKHPADLVQKEGTAFSVEPNFGRFEETDDVLLEYVGGQLSETGFGFDEETRAVKAETGWALSGDPRTFGWVRATVTDRAGNVSVDEFQVAGVKTTSNLTPSNATVKESDFAPTLYVDKTTGPLTLTLTATVGSVIQMGAGDDIVKLDAADFDTMNFAALDGGEGTGDVLFLNADTTNDLRIDLFAFNRAGDSGDGKILTRFEHLKFSTVAENAGALSLSPEDLYRLSSDRIDTVGGGSWKTLVVSGDANDTVSLVQIDLSPDDGFDQDFYQVGEAGKFTDKGAAGTGYTKLRAVVVDADGSHEVELLIASAVTLDPGSIDLQREYPVIIA